MEEGKRNTRAEGSSMRGKSQTPCPGSGRGSDVDDEGSVEKVVADQGQLGQERVGL